jgi:PAS domain S-box-containing protein
MQNLPGMAYRCTPGPERSIEFASDGCLELTGYPASDLVESQQTSCGALVHPDDRGRLWSAVQAAMAEDQPFQAVYRITTASGTEKWVWDQGRAVRSAGGVVALEGFVADITGFRRAEEERSRLAAVVEQTAEVVIMADPEGTIVYVNPAFEQVTGFPAGDVLGVTPKILGSGVHSAEFWEEMWRTIRAGEVWRGEIVNRRRDGALFTSEQTIGPVRDERGRITHFVSIGQDVTARKDLEAQLLQSQKMDTLGQLASGIAHDFNNLLTVILSRAEMMRTPLFATEKMGGYLDVILEAGARAAALTHQLLAFSRKQVLQPRVISLNAVVDDVTPLFSRLVGEHVTFVTRREPALALVKADSDQMGQVILNLVVNARDAMPQGGQITIETANVESAPDNSKRPGALPPGRYVTLAVSDTGVGIAEKDRAKIFEPFFTTKPSDKGTGLGLSTTHGIVTQSGGHITVVSEPGQGATFTVYLPRVDGTAEPTRTGVASGSPASGTETILLVEDEEMVREITDEALRAVGYTVLAARNAEEAFQQSASHPGPIHLLLTDVVMPGMSGREVAERLLHERPELKVLYTSGHTDDAMIRHGVVTRKVAFLSKPYSLSALGARLRAMFEGEHD